LKRVWIAIDVHSKRERPMCPDAAQMKHFMCIDAVSSEKQRTSRLEKTSWNFMRLQQTWWDFMGPYGISWNFKRLHDWSLYCFSLSRFMRKLSLNRSILHLMFTWIDADIDLFLVGPVEHRFRMSRVHLVVRKTRFSM
jgi:hypothetical protein